MAGSTNILQWNPTGVNQEDDGEYASDAQRSGGATNPSIFDATLANKLFYQVTAVCYALCKAYAAAGYVMDDSDVSTMMAAFEAVLAVLPNILSVAFAATLTFDCATANGFEVTLTGNLTSLTVSNGSLGKRLMLVFPQDGTGGRTVAFPANIINPGTPDPTPNATSMQEFMQLADGNFHPITVMTVS